MVDIARNFLGYVSGILKKMKLTRGNLFGPLKIAWLIGELYYLSSWSRETYQHLSTNHRMRRLDKGQSEKHCRLWPQ